MYKLIAIDIDGTLINSYGEITNENKNAVKKANEAGINVILASGRNYATIQNFSNDLNLNKYAICGNGSSIYDIKNNKVIYEKTLSKEKVLDIIKICEENSIYYNIYTESSILTQKLNYNTLVYYNENLKKQDGKKTYINIIENLYKYVKESEIDKYLKITICDDSQVIFKNILKTLKNIKGIDVLDVEHMSRKIIKTGSTEIKVEYFYTEVTAENTDKWNAIKFLAKELGIENKEVLTIGDNINDKTMIENAGLGIAMGNSNPSIKEVADCVVNDNDPSGVAQAINKFVF